MNLRHSLLMVSMSAAICSTDAYAADYLVQAIRPGPVLATALPPASLPAATRQDHGQKNEFWSDQWSKKHADIGEEASPSAQRFDNLDGLLRSGRLRGGDRVFLMDGYHGPMIIAGQKFDEPVLFAPAPGQTAHVDFVKVRGSSNLVIRGLQVWPVTAMPEAKGMVISYPDTGNITFEWLDVRGHVTSGSYMNWPEASWKANKFSGFYTDGDRISVTNNRSTGVNFGIRSIGRNALIEKNIIDGFSGDGLRALGDNSVVRGNKVQNCIKIDGNHDDGFQTFTRGSDGKVGTGVQKDLTIEDNEFYEWVSPNAHPLRCKMQGIGMFDGIYEGVKIRNNVISVTAYHGIAVSGGLNALISNNTVVHADGRSGKHAWIKIGTHKNGTPSRNVLVANNLANAVVVTPDAVNNIRATNNVIVSNVAAEFTSPSTRDYSLVATSKASNTGNPAYASSADITGVERPKGRAPDVGAYESH